MILLGLVVGTPYLFVGQVAAQRGKDVPRWEYATVAFVSGKGASWETPTETVYGTTFEELNRKMGLPESATQSTLFTRIGRDGWELVTHTMRTIGGPTPGTHAVWTFKRAVK
jgi:hypothetical protein